MAGIALHWAIESWELSGRSTEIVNWVGDKYQREIQMAEEIWPDQSQWLKPPRWSTETAINHYEAKAKAAAVAYRTEALSGSWEIVELPDMSPAIEVPFELDLGGIRVVGAVDVAVTWPDGTITVRDYKSGTRIPGPQQLGLYALALNELFGWKITHGDYWAGKRDNKTKETRYGSQGMLDLSRYTREYLTELYQTLDRGIDQKIFLPNPGDQCTLCGVQKFCREQGG